MKQDVVCCGPRTGAAVTRLVRPCLAAILAVAFLIPSARAADPAEVARLRAQGQPALDALIERAGGVGHRPDDPADADLIDAVAGQKDAWASGLFWHTDLDAARREATRTGRPILSLRLLGRLDSELSCANSRFFRVALYPDPAVRALLRDRFVLHWQSERPVPVVTIDFGDGRRLVRTVTGNSVHYVLSPDGRPIDAIPGLYAPAAFADALARSATFYFDTALDWDAPGAVPDGVRDHHRASARGAAAELARLSGEPSALSPGTAPGAGASRVAGRRSPAARRSRATAVEASRLTMSKTIAERPTLRAVSPQGTLIAVDPARLDDDDWRSVADGRYAADRLSAPAAELFRSKLPAHVAADPDAVAGAVADFERSMALDTAVNEFRLRPAIRGYFAAGEAGDLESLNARVYAEVFLTPATDPWLGLGDGGAFLAIDPAVASAAPASTASAD